MACTTTPSFWTCMTNVAQSTAIWVYMMISLLPTGWGGGYEGGCTSTFATPSDRSSDWSLAPSLAAIVPAECKAVAQHPNPPA